MRRIVALILLATAGLLLAACQQPEIVIPTVAQLPTITPTPTEAVLSTATPLPLPTATATEVLPPTDEPPTEAPATATPTENTAVGLALVTPTPEALDDAAGADDAVIAPNANSAGMPPLDCSQAEINTVLANVDVETLRADLATLSEQLPTAAGTVGDWMLDPASVTIELDDLPLLNARYTRRAVDGPQEMPVRLWLTDAALRGLFTRCLSEEVFFIQQAGEIGQPTQVSLEPLTLGDASGVARLVVDPGEEMAGTGISAFHVEVYFVLRSNLMAQFVNLVEMAQFTGNAPVTDADAQAMLAALVEALAVIL